MLFGDKIEPRRSGLRSTLPKLTFLLAVVTVFQALITKTQFFEQKYSSVEAFVPLYTRTRDFCPVVPRTRRIPPSCGSILISKMTFDRNDGANKKSSDTKQRPPQKEKDPRRREATTNAAPMYITIGPQCCGKSSFLRDFGNGTIKDISLDDQMDVYVPIPTDIFLHAYDQGDEPKSDEKLDPLIQQVYHGKSLAERIRENVELILILRRWNGDSTASDFQRRVQNYYEERNLDANIGTALVEAVEDFLSHSPALPKATDVFVLESLFKPHPKTGQSAIQRAHEELRETPKHIPVAWGNTNSKAKDYERALEICHQTRRPVHFILCHPEHSDANDANNESELMTLPWLPLEELLKRNLHRLQTQGKFVPANAIADCRQRVEAMLPQNKPNIGDNKWIEEHLVAIASPSAGGRGRTDNRRPTFRYVLTKHRLVQKEYPRNDARQNYRPNNQGRGRFNGRGRGRYNDGRGRGRYGDRTREGPSSGGYRNRDRPPPNDAPPRARRKINDST